MIELHNVTRVHKRGHTEVRALRGISCTIEDGTFNFIVGPSGSGKSTLLYLIGGLDEPSGGEILIDGQPLATMTAKQRTEFRRQTVGFIFQSFNLLANLNAVDNVLVPFMPQGVSDTLRADAVQLLRAVGLSDRLDHRPAHLSGGEQQRVAIARALLKKPKIVLADEPTGELDTSTGAEVFQYLRQLHEQEQSTVIVVTHDQSYIQPSDNVIRILDGQQDG